MKFDISVIGLIVAVLAFYLRLMQSHRQKVKAWEAGQRDAKSGRKKGSRKKDAAAPAEKPSFGSFSKRKRDWLVGGIGYLFIMMGVLLYIDVLKSDFWTTVWWVPISLGIVAFSWFFN
jgi:hypothetical protein